MLVLLDATIPRCPEADRASGWCGRFPSWPRYHGVRWPCRFDRSALPPCPRSGWQSRRLASQLSWTAKRWRNYDPVGGCCRRKTTSLRCVGLTESLPACPASQRFNDDVLILDQQPSKATDIVGAATDKLLAQSLSVRDWIDFVRML